MLKVHRIHTTQFRTWGPDITDSDPNLLSPTNLTPESSFQSNDSWVDIGGNPTTTHKDSQPPFEGAGRLICHSPTNEMQESESQVFDTVTFPRHAVHLLPSEQTGTWYAQASRTFMNPSECASSVRKAFREHVYELDLPRLVRRSRQVAQDCEQEVSGWLHQPFANHGLVEMHGRAQRLISTVSMPNMRQIHRANDKAADLAQSARKRHSESQLLQAPPVDKRLLAQVISRRAERALVIQGICKDWQLVGDRQEKLLHAIQLSLIHTFRHTQRSFTGVPLYRANPQWTADREKNVWCLELDVGRVGVEVGPATDRSLIELGFIKTGFELPEWSGGFSVEEFDRRIRTVEDEWQLL